jgi:hypothetical protein
MFVNPHPPYFPHLAPCDFFLFPKIKLKLKGRRFDTIDRIQTESQRVLDTLKKRISSKRSKKDGDGGISVYIREGTTSRMVAASRPCDESSDFYSVRPEYFGLKDLKYRMIKKSLCT